MKRSKKPKSSPLHRPPIEQRHLSDADGATFPVIMHIAESPLVWLRTRKDKDGAPLVDDMRFAAGERLRSDFTRAQLSPRTSMSWDFSHAARQRGMPDACAFSDGTLAARQRVNDALKAVGPELSGLLQDVCCFLKSIAQVESERRWPPRSARIVLLIALERLAAHYGFSSQAAGKNGQPVRSWGAEDYRPVIQY